MVYNIELDDGATDSREFGTLTEAFGWARELVIVGAYNRPVLISISTEGGDELHIMVDPDTNDVKQLYF